MRRTILILLFVLITNLVFSQKKIFLPDKDINYYFECTSNYIGDSLVIKIQLSLRNNLDKTIYFPFDFKLQEVISDSIIIIKTGLQKPFSSNNEIAKFRINLLSNGNPHSKFKYDSLMPIKMNQNLKVYKDVIYTNQKTKSKKIEFQIYSEVIYSIDSLNSIIYIIPLESNNSLVQK